MSLDLLMKRDESMRIHANEVLSNYMDRTTFQRTYGLSDQNLDRYLTEVKNSNQNQKRNQIIRNSK